jgi:hypothetical protein
MSIITTSSLIKINKPNGDPFFNSGSKFIYIKRSATGSLTINNSSTYTVNYDAPSSTEFTVKFVTITSSNGDGTTNLIGLKLPIDFGLLLHVHGWNKNNAVAAYSIALVSGESGNTVKFEQKSTWPSETSYVNLTFTYHFITYAYL